MTLKTILRAVVPVLLVAALAASAWAGDQDLRIRIKVNSANLRLKPGLQSTVIGSAKQGQVFDVLRKEADWYFIQLPPDAQGNVISGYVHSSVVEEMAAPAEPRPADKPVERPETARPQTPRAAASRPGPRAQAPAAPDPARKKFYVRLGGGYGTQKSDYVNEWGFDLYHETGYVSESYALDQSGVAFEAGVGFLFSRNLGVEISFLPASGTSRGVFASGFPHPFYFELFRGAEWTSDLKYSANEINVDLVASLPVMSNLLFNVQAGGTYFMGVQIEFLDDLGWGEMDYPYGEISVDPGYAKYKGSAFGFNGGAGLDYFFTPGIALSLGGRYSAGTAKIDADGTEYKVKAGGLRATAGIKLAF